MFKRTAIFLLLASLFTACSTTPEKPEVKPPAPRETTQGPKLGPPQKLKNDSSITVYPAEFAALAGWDSDNHAAAFISFQRSCASWRAQPDDKKLGGVFELGRIGDWKKLCKIQVRQGEEKQFFEKWFKPYAVADKSGFEGLFTGYYLPELHGSNQKSARFNVPIYGMPKDLVKRDGKIGRMENGNFLPYYEREEIANGALNGKNAELLWVDSETDAYFMEVQGSGRVIMEDGHMQGLSFAGKNGRSYYAIGKWLVDNGYLPLEQVSMQSIRAWIESHPEEGRGLMMKNQSYVFFRLTDVKAWEGPIGTTGAPLTAGYSLAVDRNYVPLGVPLWLDAEHPDGSQRIQRLVMAQDTGGAIKGLIRGDVYWGQGKEAGDLAGVMRSRGRYFILAPRQIGIG